MVMLLASQNEKEFERCDYLMPAMKKTHFLVDPCSTRASVFLKRNKLINIKVSFIHQLIHQ